MRMDDIAPAAGKKFAQLEQAVNKKAAEYARQGGGIQLREEVWLALWEMRSTLFCAKAVRGYRSFSPSALYETGEEFLEEVLLEAIPQLLEGYAKEQGGAPAPPPFMKYFNACFPRKVYDAYSKIQDNSPHAFLVVRAREARVYQEPREGALIPGDSLKKGMVRRILGRVSDGKEEWIKTKQRLHGRTVYVRGAEVECCEKVAPADIDSIGENVDDPDLSQQPGGRMMLSGIYEEYILALLSLVEQLYARAPAQGGKGLSRRYCFQLLYTETLLDKLKGIYDAIGDVRATHEREALSVAETGLLDYLLTKECRTFSSIAVTPLHSQRHFTYLHTASTQPVRIPVASIIYAHFLVDIQGIHRKLDSIPPSISKYRAEFNRQYALLCGADQVRR